MPKLPRAAADTRPGPALSRTGPETPWGGRLGRLGVSAPSGTSRDLSTVSLRSVCSGSYRGHSTAWAMAPLFTAWLTGYVKPIVETRCSEKNPFQNMPAPGQGAWPRQSPTAAGGHSRHTRQTAAPTDAGHRRAGARLRQPRASHRGRGRRVPDSSTADTRQPRSLGHQDTRHHPCSSRHGGVRNATAERRPRQEPHEPRAGRTRGAGPRGPPRPGCRRRRGNTVSKAPGGGPGPRRQRKDGSNGSLIRNYCLGYSGSFVGSREF